MDRTNPTCALAEDLFTRLVEALERGDPTPLTHYFTALQRFHRYSVNNVLLILAQRPSATRVAGFHTWRTLGRTVRRGEKGIAILAPLVRRRRPDQLRGDDDTSDEQHNEPRRAVYGWRAVYVFDIAQTDGSSIPTYTLPATTGDVGPFLTRLTDFVRGLGITLNFVGDLGGALGQCRPGAQSIDVLNSLSPATTFATLAHELAHDLLHRRDDPARPATRTGRETEAEAVAAVVTGAIGLDHLEFARDYIRLYHGDAELLRASLTRIQHTATAILTALLEEPPTTPRSRRRLARRRPPDLVYRRPSPWQISGTGQAKEETRLHVTRCVTTLERVNVYREPTPLGRQDAHLRRLAGPPPSTDRGNPTRVPRPPTRDSGP